MFELRKNKWLSHGQPGCNFWLSVQVFGCPYTLNKIYGVEFHSWGMKIYGCPSDNHISIFGCPATFLVVPGARTTKFSNAAWEPLDLNKVCWFFSYAILDRICAWKWLEIPSLHMLLLHTWRVKICTIIVI